MVKGIPQRMGTKNLIKIQSLNQSDIVDEKEN